MLRPVGGDLGGGLFYFLVIYSVYIPKCKNFLNPDLDPIHIFATRQRSEIFVKCRGAMDGNPKKQSSLYKRYYACLFSRFLLREDNVNGSCYLDLELK